MALMTQKLTEPGTGNGAQGPEALPVDSWMTSKRYDKSTLTNTSNNCRGDWGHQLRGWKREEGIIIMFQNMGG